MPMARFARWKIRKVLLAVRHVDEKSSRKAAFLLLLVEMMFSYRGDPHSDFKALFVVFFAYQELPQDNLLTNDKYYPNQRPG
ncbi:MAG: hypothetical protein OEZ15_09630 [Gammaproteobacteria bacterium]|nr:hypothetical protein [Gammaproteobacteria bacterium]